MKKATLLTALALCPGIGNKTLLGILEQFSDPHEAWQASPAACKALGWSDKQVEAFVLHRKKVSLEKIQEDLAKANIKLFTIYDEDYPMLLKEIPNPPTLLYVRGSIPQSELAIAMVGTRHPTPYGKVIAEKLAEDLAGYNINVVSGMARGIDSCAHRGALMKGETVAVLGCGVDVVYPRENAALMEEIINHGAIVSEFPPGTNPEPGFFPARNRIISGLSKGVLVVEAAKKSGSLITADFALEQGRDVFAVPGPVTSKNSAGCHYLIKNGAKLTAEVQDILEEYGYMPMINEMHDRSLNDKEKAILINLSYEPKHFEELLSKTGLHIGALSKILLQLELKNEIKQLPGQYYVIDKYYTR